MIDTGTDQRRFNFFIIDNEVFDHYDLNPFEGWLYVAIVRHLNQQTGVAFPSLATLAEKTNMSEPTVVKYLKSLEEKNLITITQQYDPDTKEHKSNHYTIMGVVKEVNQGGKSNLPGVVKEVKTNKTNVNKTSKDLDHDLPIEATSDPEAIGDDEASASHRACDGDTDTIQEPFIKDWQERGFSVGQDAFWWYPEGNKYVAGTITKLTPNFAFFQSTDTGGKVRTVQVGPARCSVDGVTDGWTLVSELDAIQCEIAVGSYGMTSEQAVSEQRMKEINMHRADLREQFKNGHSVEAAELRAAYGYQKQQHLTAPKERGKIADMINAYRATKPAAVATEPHRAPHELADPHCTRCNGTGLVRGFQGGTLACPVCRKDKKQ